MDTRKNIYSLNAKELAAYRDAVNGLKAAGTYDQFITRHFQAMMNFKLMAGETLAITRRDSAHRGPVFGPWHRWFLRDFELALQSVTPGVTLPYWDWAQDADAGNPEGAQLWSDDFMGSDGVGTDDVVPDGPFTHWIALIRDAAGALVPRGFAGLVRRLGRDPQGFSTLPPGAEVIDTLSEGAYDASPWRESSAPSFRNRLEGWLIRPNEPLEPRMHNRVHTWVGGDMMFPTSPNDPVFFLHHCNIDRLWAKWQTDNPGSPYLPASGGPPTHNETDDMDDLGAPGVTPASVLDFQSMGYDYDVL